MKKILSFVLSGFLLFSNMAPVYAQAVSQPGAVSLPVSEQFNPAELVASLNEIYAQFEAAAANETESPSGMEAGSEEENKAVLAQIGKAVFLLYETPGYKSQAEDFIFKLFPFIAPFLEEEERQKGVRVLHKFILACEDGTEDTCQRSLDAAVILGLMGRFDKDSEEAIALVNFLKVGENTPLYPYIIQAVGQTLLAVAPGVLVDAVMGKVKTSPSYGFFSGEYTLDVHSLMTKVFVGNGFSRGMERSYYPSDKGGHNFRNAWSNLGRFWAKEASSDTNLRNELNRLLAWCIEDEDSVRFKPFVAGVLSTGYIYNNDAEFSQAVAKHMFQMSKGDLDPFTATYMENLLAVGFHKLGGQDDGFNKLLTFQNKLTPEGKRALLSEYKCPSVSDFNEEVNLNELPRGSICQWRYASLDKINTNSLQLLTVDVVGHAIDAIGLVFGVAGLAKLSVSGVKNLKAIFRFIKTHRMAGQSYKEISKILFRLSRIKVTSAYRSVAASVRNAYLGVRYNKLKSVVLSNLDTALTNMSSGFVHMRPFLAELKTKLAGLSNEISPKELGQILEEVFGGNDYLQKLLKHPAAIGEMNGLLQNTPEVVAKQFLAILENERFWRLEGFKYFEILNKNTLIPVVEIEAYATGKGVMPFTEFVMRHKNVDEIVFKLSKNNLSGFSLQNESLIAEGGRVVGRIEDHGNIVFVHLQDPLGANKAIFDGWIAKIRASPGFGRVIKVRSHGEPMKSFAFKTPTTSKTDIRERDIISQLNGGETKGNFLRLSHGQTDPVELLVDLWHQTRGQFHGNIPADGQVKVRFTSAEVPSDPKKLYEMHVHLEFYDPAKGFLRNENFLLYGTERQRSILFRFIKKKAPADPNVRFDVFELPEIKSRLNGIAEAPIPLEEGISAAQYDEMFA